jgi:hypothetical protein
MYWECFHINQIWDRVEELKIKLSAIHPIWDFSGYNSITMESLPLETKFYDDCSHYTPKIGNLLIGKILGKENLDCGHLLTPANVRSVNEQIRTDREKWLLTNPASIQDLKKEFL